MSESPIVQGIGGAVVGLIAGFLVLLGLAFSIGSGPKEFGFFERVVGFFLVSLPPLGAGLALGCYYIFVRDSPRIFDISFWSVISVISLNFMVGLFKSRGDGT